MAEAVAQAHGFASATSASQYTVDLHGNGSGKIESSAGDVYQGEFKQWRRHGRGQQTWASGEVFTGSWVGDAQHEGVFIDAQGRKWAGNWLTRQIRLIGEFAPPPAAPETPKHAEPEIEIEDSIVLAKTQERPSAHSPTRSHSPPRTPLRLIGLQHSRL